MGECYRTDTEFLEESSLAHFINQIGLRYFLINKNTESFKKIAAPGNNITWRNPVSMCGVIPGCIKQTFPECWKAQGWSKLAKRDEDGKMFWVIISKFSSNNQRIFFLSRFQKLIYSYKYTMSYLSLCHKQQIMWISNVRISLKWENIRMLIKLTLLQMAFKSHQDVISASLVHREKD